MPKSVFYLEASKDNVELDIKETSCNKKEMNQRTTEFLSFLKEK